ncbi:MAG: TonB-dependent receptor [Burkholderiales bacterium]|nr:TonB-dependent receptor [Burkholderiales bacterium]
MNWVSNRKRAVGDVRTTEVADYTSVDLVVRSTMINNWEFVVGARNLLNKDIREPSVAPGVGLPGDLPQAGRTYFLQASYKL